MDALSILTGAVVGLGAGAAAGYTLFNKILTKRSEQIIAEAELKGETIKEKKSSKRRRNSSN